MNQVGLIHIILLRSHMSPFAGWLFSGAHECGLKAGDPCQTLGQDSDPQPQQTLELAATETAPASDVVYTY